MRKRKEILFLVLGILLGTAGTLAGGILWLRMSLIREFELGSPDFQTAMRAVPGSAKEIGGWTASSAGCALPQTPDGLPLLSFRFCNPDYARELIRNESERKIAAILPCGIAFYRKSDGKVYASKLNLPLVGLLLGGTPSRLFSRRIEPDQRAILMKIAEKSEK